MRPLPATLPATIAATMAVTALGAAAGGLLHYHAVIDGKIALPFTVAWIVVGTWMFVTQLARIALEIDATASLFERLTDAAAPILATLGCCVSILGIALGLLVTAFHVRTSATPPLTAIVVVGTLTSCGTAIASWYGPLRGMFLAVIASAAVTIGAATSFSLLQAPPFAVVVPLAWQIALLYRINRQPEDDTATEP
jgi:hypothetical protein